MPKIKPTVNEWIRGHPELHYELNKLICRACQKNVNCEKKFNITQHIQTRIHKDNLNKFNQTGRKQKTIQECIAGTSTQNQENFCFDLCNTMIATDIPLAKLNSSVFKEFLQKYCGHHIPSESTVRKTYVDRVYKEVMGEIKDRIGNNFIWFGVDETTDACGRYIAHLIIGTLNEDKASNAYLISSKELEKTNNNTITRFVHDELSKFFLPNPMPSEKILLMLSDAAAYMKKAYSNIKVLYENLIHCTCLAHGLNLVAEIIRQQFPLVNNLIKFGKKIFVKAPLRVQYFKERAPGVPLPPEPVVTRWGTWLEAALYYAEHFDAFRGIVLEFSSSDSQSIKECQRYLEDNTIQQNLQFLKANYAFVPVAIKKLETAELSLNESLKIVEDFRIACSMVEGNVGSVVKNKLDDVLTKNEGYRVLVQVAKVLEGEIIDELPVKASHVSKFKFAPITSVDVERSFSQFKHILSDRRRSFTTENLEKHVIINSFRKL